MKMRNIAILLRFQFGWDRDLAQGIAQYARTRPQWRLFVWPRAQDTFVAPTGWRCHGAIGHLSSPVEVVAGGAPLVFVGSRDVGVASVQVSPDEHAIGRLAAEHLHQCGFRRVTCYGGTKPWAKAREAGFRETVESLGMTYIPCPLYYSHRDDVDWTNAVSVLAHWLRKVPGPLGLMGVNDNAARVASEACHVAGLRLPEQVGVIGVDNDLLRCELSGTPLSSVDPAADRLGFVAAQVLDHLLTTGQQPELPILVPPRHVVRRRSTDIVAVEDTAVAEAVRFLRDRVFEAITVDDVAEAACLSRSALHRRFKRHMGRSVQQEMTRLRIQQACELLRNGETGLTQVASASGFDNLSYFHRIFKQHTGRTPTAYRRAERSPI